MTRTRLAAPKEKARSSRTGARRSIGVATIATEAVTRSAETGTFRSGGSGTSSTGQGEAVL
jgi:hypothetical protein